MVLSIPQSKSKNLEGRAPSRDLRLGRIYAYANFLLREAEGNDSEDKELVAFTFDILESTQQVGIRETQS